MNPPPETPEEDSDGGARVADDPGAKDVTDSSAATADGDEADSAGPAPVRYVAL